MVIGASDTVGRPNTLITSKLKAWAEDRDATFIPVNPNRDSVHGVRCATSVDEGVAAAGGSIDLAVVLTGDVAGSLEQVIDAGIAFAVAFGAGFAEIGPEGARAQAAIAELVAEGDTHLLGPNTNLNAFEEFDHSLPAPSIALVTQSGHQGRPIFQAQEIGISMSHWAPTGNEVDLEFADFAAYFARRPEVGCVAAYIEGFKDGRTLCLAADAALEAGTPIVMVKVGRTEEGASMASSHTGKLTGADAVVDAAFDQFGVQRFDGLDEMLDAAQMLCRAPAPRRADPGVAVYAISGGTGAHMADLVSAAGLRLPDLAPETQDTLHEWIPDYLRVSNPIDNGGHPVGDERGRKILDVLVHDPDIDVLVAPITGAFPPMSDKLAQDLVDVAESSPIPVCVIWGSPSGTEAAYRDILLSSSKVAVFRTFGNCVAAITAWRDWHAFRSTYVSPFTKAPRRASRAAAPSRELIGTKHALSEFDSKLILAEYGIDSAPEHLVTSAAEAARAGADIGFPVVMKACAADLAHKSELGLVRVGVQNASEAKAVFADLVQRAPDDPDGVIVAEQVSGGIEMVVGVSRDPIFGPVVMCGLGGVFVEVLNDVAFRVPPFTRRDARAMIDGLQGRAVLAGARGAPAADIGAVVDVIMKVQRLALDLADDVAEVDINPLLVGPKGTGAVALDALVVPG
jgi:acyl-CoA synthetase (NDP forming)